MAKCPRCHLKFRSVILRKVEGRGWYEGKWRESLACGHHRFFSDPADSFRNVWAARRACADCLAAHHKELGVA
jgi:hypothetical protein